MNHTKRRALLAAAAATATLLVAGSAVGATTGSATSGTTARTDKQLSRAKTPKPAGHPSAPSKTTTRTSATRTAAPALRADSPEITDAGCTESTLAANDDGSTPAVGLPFTAKFFGPSYNALYVNNNG